MASLEELRHGNRIRLLEALRVAGEADRAQLSRLTGLSRATVSGLLGEAIAAGHVLERRSQASALGRGSAPAMLRLDPRAGVVGGVDLGHRHVRVLLADLCATVLGERVIALDVDAEPAAAVDAAAGLLDELRCVAGVAPDRLLGVAMGVPKPLVREAGTVRSASSAPGWAGADPGEELARRLGVPVRIENDANLGVLGEHAHGAARRAMNVVYVKLSTGVGAGLLLDGSLYVGSSGLAGELGHVTVEPGGSICRCGNRGCLETVASAAALARTLGRTGGDPPKLPQLLDRLREGDAEVERGLQAAGRRVGRALAPLCLALDVQLVVVGGELGAASSRLVAAVRAELRRTSGWGAPPTVRPALLGDRAEALGAIALALDQEDWLRGAGLIALDATGEDSGRGQSARPLGAAAG